MKISQRKVDGWVEEIVEALGLGDWRIRVVVGPCPGDNLGDMGCTSAQPQYKSGDIWIDPKMHSSSTELYSTLLHEMIHLVLSPMDEALVAMEGLLEDPVKSAVMGIWEFRLEEVTCSLEKVMLKFFAQ